MTETPTEKTTGCVIVGGGPGGMILAYLLARQGIETTLLEMHADFDREFRGDTFHGSTMELMSDLGLAAEVEAILHSKLKTLYFHTDGQRFPFVDLGVLPGPYNYVGLIPQAEFLAFVADRGRRLPTFRLEFEATARELIEEDGRVVGIEYRQGGQVHRLRAPLVVGADGRASRIRRVAGLEIESSAPPMDVMWFKLPRAEGDDRIDPLAIRFGVGKLLIVVNRGDYWQLGYIVVKGSSSDVKSAGIERFREEIAGVVPEFRERLAGLSDWKEVAILAVQTGRVPKWYKPGLLLIGDAAHIMSPIGGVGINYAVMDAVAAANLLTDPLKAGRVETEHLAAVQARREFPTRVIQRFQSFLQNRIVAKALNSGEPFRPPLAMRLVGRLPVLRAIPARLIGRGVRVERLRHREAAIHPTSEASAAGG